MEELKEQLKQAFLRSLPLWISKDSPLLEAFADTTTQALSEMIYSHIEESDFLNYPKAQRNKQDDYTLYEVDEVAQHFKDKYRILFRRGTALSLDEISRMVNSENARLFYDTQLFYDTPLGNENTVLVTPSNQIVSGFIAGITFPSINRVSLSLPSDTINSDLNEYVFSQRDFLVVELQNKSEFYSEELQEILMHNFFPFAIPALINFNKSKQ